MANKAAINNWVRINGASVTKGGTSLGISLEDATPEALYRALQYSYPKFFKMDVLSKWAWLAAETLLKQDTDFIYSGLDKNKVAVVLMTGKGCLDVDKKYNESVKEIASPALFVYTLPNIMLGEICIRHGFKGEQACMVSEHFDTDELHFWVDNLLHNQGMDACLFGWVDAAGGTNDICLFWADKRSDYRSSLSAAAISRCYNT